MTPEELKKTADKLRALADDLESGRWEAIGVINSITTGLPITLMAPGEGLERHITVFFSGYHRP